MRLKGEQVLALRLVMQSLLPREIELRQFMLEELNRDLDVITEGPLEARCSAIVARADAEGWLDILLEKLTARFPRSQELKDVIARLGATGKAATADPHGACYFRRRPFIDREHLRGALRSMTAPDGARILLVDGPPVSGKSYSVNLVHHLAASHRFGVVYIDLLAYGPIEITPLDIADAIALQMSLTMPPRQEQEQSSRWTIWFCNWLVGQLRDKGTWWIVFDSFEQVRLSADALDLVRQLSRHVDGMLDNVRLVLLSFDDVLPHEVAPAVERESIDRIDRVHLTDFFIQFYLENGHAADEKLADSVAKVVHQILQKVAEDDPRRLVTLGSAVTEECRNILAEQP